MNTWVASFGVARFVWSRHRWLLGACGILYAATYLATQLLPAELAETWLRGIWPLLNLAPVILPLVAFVSPSSTFTLDLATTESRYPLHFFSLPLNNRQLVLPFFVGAALVAALLWGAGFTITDGRLLTGPQPIPAELRGVNTGVAILPLLLMSGVAWVQALVWMSFRRRGTRVWILLASVLAHLTLLVLIADHTVSLRRGFVICGVSLCVAMGVGIWGIGRARRGDPLVRQKSLAEPRARKRARALPRRPFATPLAAQTWMEWQAHGARNRTPFLLLVPLILALIVPATLAGHWLPHGPASSAALFAILGQLGALVFCVMVFLAFVSGPGAASFRSTLAWSRDDEFAMPPFFAALPLSSGDFAWAKMKTAARGTFVLAGLFLVYLIPLALVFRQLGFWDALFETLRDQHGTLEAVLRVTLVPAAVGLFIVAFAANVVWTALFGRGWRIASVAIVIVATLPFLWGSMAQMRPEWAAALSSAALAVLPWLAVAKIGALASLAQRVAVHRHYSMSRIVSILAVWTVAVLAAWGLVLRLVPEADALRALCDLIVVMPVLGIVGAPLVMQSNRAR